MYERVGRLAVSLRQRYGQGSPLELCDQMGIPVLEEELPESVEGFYVKNGGAAIVLRRGLDPARKEYICAHELGHVLLHSGVNRFFLEEETLFPAGRMEGEADLFAAYLLLDGNVETLRDEYEQLTVEQAAALTGLPPEAVAMRYAQDLPNS